MTDRDEIQIRVRYAETDRMGLLHHANYLVYFEMGRTELLRRRGITYRDMEDDGHLLLEPGPLATTLGAENVPPYWRLVEPFPPR